MVTPLCDRYMIVLDIGTSSMRGILCDGRGDFQAARQVQYRPDYLPDGRVEQRASVFLEAMTGILHTLGDQAKTLGYAVEAVSITSQRSAITVLDSEGVPLLPFIMWQDMRNGDLCCELAGSGVPVREICGSQINTIYSGGKMSWILKHSGIAVPEGAHFVNIPEYLMYCLTGELVTDHTYASRSNLMDLRRGQWDERLLELFGIQREQLCRLVPPGSIAGNLTEEYARLTGLSPGIPVITAGGDQNCGAIGQGAFAPGVLSVVCGTGAYMITSCHELPEVFEEGTIYNASAVKGMYIRERGMKTCAAAFDWYLKNFYGEPVDYSRIEEALQSCYEKGGTACTALPYLQGQTSHLQGKPETACFTGMTLSTGREEMLLALLESIFLEMEHHLSALNRDGAIHQVLLSGGMTEMDFLNQLQADCYGVEVLRYEHTETTALGAFMIGALTLGWYDSIPQAYKAVTRGQASKRYMPAPEKKDYIAHKKELMTELYQQLYGGNTNE